MFSRVWSYSDLLHGQWFLQGIFVAIGKIYDLK